MTMVERMAKWAAEIQLGVGTWDELTAKMQDDWRNHAVLHLQAMREPTEAIVSEYGEPFCEADAQRNEAIWQAMIDAAIAEHAATAIGNRRA